MKYILAGFLFFLIATVSAQIAESDTLNNEVRMDAFGVIAFKYIDLSYERLLNEEAAFGVNIQFTLDGQQEDLGYVRQFSITPFYRQYFSKKYAKGFFVEGFATYANVSEYHYDYVYDSVLDSYMDIYEEVNFNQFALGISIGGKFVTSRGFVAEIFAGIGRNLLDTDDENYYRSEIIGRGGIALGYRF